MKVGVCSECRDETRWHALRATLTRQRVMNGPDGRSLCQKHHHEAWEQHMKETYD